ncbi:MAG: DMT family transporter [Oligoflexales bacterium]
MSTRTKFDISALHFVILLWGASGLVGDSISLSSAGVVFYRSFFAMIAMVAYCFLWKKENLDIPIKEALALTGSGLILGVHWWCFFQAINVSTISIGLICLSATSFFLSILEPLYTRQRMKKSEIIMGICCVLSLTMIYNFELAYVLGILLGLGAAFSDSIYSIMTGQLVKSRSSSLITVFQMFGSCISALALGSFYEPVQAMLAIPSGKDLLGLLFLGLVCSAFAMAIYIDCLKRLSTFTAVLSLNMEPVYGILLALLVRGETEYMSRGFYMGALVLIGCVSTDLFLKHGSTKHLKA